jgi:hypothetical protein
MEPYNPNKPWISVNLPSREELIAMAMGLIPGGRALKYYHDNPEGSIIETLDLAAEDLVPLYASLIKPAIKGDDIDTEQALKEAAIFGIPMPYTRFPKGHPKAGEAIPNNLKEAVGDRKWQQDVWGWNTNYQRARKLYADPNSMRGSGFKDARENLYLSTRARTNTTANARTPIDIPAGPYIETNTGSNIVNTGRQANGTNQIPLNLERDRTKDKLDGSIVAWQGDMYPPGRSLRKDDMYGPFQWEDAYSRKLNDVINENENKWEYLINKTRPARKSTLVVPKEDIASIAIEQGRPDIAARVMSDNKPRLPNKEPEINRYATNQAIYKLNNKDWKDIGNRQVEKELRETFATLPEDDAIRYRFADYYGVPDLYNDWKSNPVLWNKYKEETLYKRVKRGYTNHYKDTKYKRNIER